MARRAAGRWLNGPTCWLWALAALGAGQAAAQPAPSPAPTPTAQEPPSAELLLYLAEFADADGTPIDPAAVATALERGSPETESRPDDALPRKPRRQRPDPNDDARADRPD